MVLHTFLCATLIACVCIKRARAYSKMPVLEYKGVAVHYDSLQYRPTNDLIQPSVVSTRRMVNPKGKYYMYFSAHEHYPGVSMAYADNPSGPWREYEANPVIPGYAAPDCVWIPEVRMYYLWAHKINSETDYFSTIDGVNFMRMGTAVQSSKIKTRNASYTRVYRMKISKKRAQFKYTMLYSGKPEVNGILVALDYVWVATSKDAKSWYQSPTPLLVAKNTQVGLFGPSLLRWCKKQYVVFQSGTLAVGGGSLRYVQVDNSFKSLGSNWPDNILLQAPVSSPEQGRFRGAAFYKFGKYLYMYSGAGPRNNEIIVYAIQKINESLCHKRSNIVEQDARILMGPLFSLYYPSSTIPSIITSMHN
jgi:hypothetical protein